MATIRILHTLDSNLGFLRYNVCDGAESDDVFVNEWYDKYFIVCLDADNKCQDGKTPRLE